MSALKVSRAAVVVDGDLGHGGARRRWCRSATASAFVSSVTFGVLERRPHGEHLGVGLGVHEAREAVAGGAADAGAVGHVGLVEHDSAGRVERVVPGGGKVVGELLDARLVRHRRERIGRAGRRLGRVLAARAVHLVELLGLRVVGLHARRSRSARRARCRRGGAARRSPPRAAGRAPRRRASWRRRRSSAPAAGRPCRLGVVPGVRRDVAVVDEHVLRRPVLRLARQPVAALEQQDALARRGEAVHERAAAGAAADDDHVVAIAHPPSSSSRSARMIARPPRSARGARRPAGSCRGAGRCSVSNSSAYRPSGEATLQQRSIRSRARCSLADDRQRRDEPERADQEAALLARQAVVGLVGAVAQHEAVLGQVVGDRLDALAQALVVARAGSRRSPPAAWTRRARRCRSAGAGRRRARRARGCPP